MTYLQFMTAFHTLISVLAILFGVPALTGLFRNGEPRWASRSFLLLAGVTSITGFFFPFTGITPAIVTGIIALAVLAVVLVGEYSFLLKGAWRALYAAGLVVSQYLLVFVAVVQGFQKVPLLRRLAPTQSEAPFLAVQLAALVFFILVGIKAMIRFRPSAQRAGLAPGVLSAPARVRD